MFKMKFVLVAQQLNSDGNLFTTLYVYIYKMIKIPRNTLTIKKGK